MRMLKSEVKQEVVLKFEEFFREYVDENGDRKYWLAIEEMPIKNRVSLRIDMPDLYSFDRHLAEGVINFPDSYIPAADQAVRNLISLIDREHAERVERFHARFDNLPEKTPLREVRARHIGKLIMVEGIITRCSEVKARVIKAVYQCRFCGAKVEVFSPEGQILKPEGCGNPACRKKGGLTLLTEECIFTDWQKIRIQEKPEELPPGSLPRFIDCVLMDDLVDIARPGDRVRITGVLRPVAVGSDAKRALFTQLLEVNHLYRLTEEAEKIEITEKDKEEILKLARDKDIDKKIVASIAPSIYGLEHVKKAIALMLFGGVPKVFKDGTRIRGEINVLLIGDPGTAKSQILKYTAQIAPRGLYTTGKGSTAAGLTAAVVRDSFTGGWALEAGALVLGDKGVVCIDEFDKMRNEDRIAIHEALEQQSYHRDFELMLADGRKVKIGELVDSLIEKYRDRVVIGKDTEILYVDDLYLVGFDPVNMKEVIVKADRVSRHKTPPKFIRITFSNGRSITVTPEHPVVVWKDGRLTTVRADQVKPGMVVPGVKEYRLATNESLLRRVVARFNRRGVRAISKLAGFLASDGFVYSNSSNGYFEVGFTNSDARLVDEFKEVLCELGVKYGVQVQQPGGKRKKPLYTVRVFSKKFYELVKECFPELLPDNGGKEVRPSRLRRVPTVIFAMPPEGKKAFLNAFFKGDGFVDNYKVGFSTSSIRLAEDLQDLLLSLGISSYVDREDNNGKTYYKVVISGTESLRKFLEIVSDDKRYEKVLKLLNNSEKTLRYHDELPEEVVEGLRTILNELDLNDGYMAGLVKRGFNIHREKARKYLRMAEEKVKLIEEALEKGDIARLAKFVKLTTLQAITGTSYSTLRYRLLVKEDEEVKEHLFREARRRVLKLKKLLSWVKKCVDGDVRFFTVKNVEVIRNEGSRWVYDVTVEPYHLFVSHGLVLHNTISISKAGIVATLNARAAVLAAANPAWGRYDPSRSPADNINLPPTILSRFDLIFILTDRPNEEVDKRLSEFILKLHQAGEKGVNAPIPPRLLRKYIAYARQYVKPRLSDEAVERIKKFYLEMRKVSEEEGAPIAITPRQLEALIRMAEAKAKMHLRDVVTAEDAEYAIELMRMSLEQVGYDVKTGKIDIDKVIVGTPKSERERLFTEYKLLKKMVEEYGGDVKVEDFVERCVEELGIPEATARKDLKKLIDQGFVLKPRIDYIRPV